jgi:hypothetical protein
MWFEDMVGYMPPWFQGGKTCSNLVICLRRFHRHTLYVPMYVPVASSIFNGWLSAAAGKLPEFLDPQFVAKNEGREGRNGTDVCVCDPGF